MPGSSRSRAWTVWTHRPSASRGSPGASVSTIDRTCVRPLIAHVHRWLRLRRLGCRLALRAGLCRVRGLLPVLLSSGHGRIVPAPAGAREARWEACSLRLGGDEKEPLRVHSERLEAERVESLDGCEA